MTYDESVEWLDENGGAWTVRATSSACAVTTTVGSRQVVTRAAQLTAEGVERALVDAVSRMQHLESNGFREARMRRLAS